MAFSDTLGSAIIEVRATTDKLKRDLNVATAQTKSAFAKMKAFAMEYRFAILAVGAALVSMAGFAIKSAAKIEQLEVAFSSMLGSATAARDMVKELAEFSAKTPFQLEDIATSARMLLSARVSADLITKRLKTLGDVAAGAQIPLAEMTKIFAKVENKGKAMTEELLQMSDRGIPILAVLSDQLGVSKDKIFELASQSKITKDTVLAALTAMTEKGGVFENQTLKQSETLTGAWSTFKDNLMQLAADIGKMLLPITKSFLKMATEVIKATRDIIASMQSWKERLSEVLGLSEGLDRQWGGYGRRWNETKEKIEETADELDKTKDSAEQLDSAFNKTTNNMVDDANKAANSIGSTFGGLFNDIFGALGVKVSGGGGIGGIIGGSLLKSFGGLLGSAFSTVSSVSGLAGAFGGFFADGGQPPVGRPSIVGENGPEVFVPKTSGTVVPNGGGMGGPSVQLQNVFVGVDDQIMNKIAEATPTIVGQAKVAVADAIKRGDRRFK